MAGINVGDGISLDGRFNGHLRFKGEVADRKGIWLGLEMEDPCGDCDGSWGGTQYFQCEDGHGMFVRDNQGRVQAKPAAGTKLEDLNIPPAMLEHMKFLFDQFDEDKAGVIDEDQMLKAMKTLGGARVTKQTVRSVFAKFDNGNGDGLDFVEFCHAVKEQWGHVDLGEVVAVIEQHEAEEAAAAEAEARKKQGMVVDATVLTVRVGRPAGEGPGFDVNLKYFGKGANAFLLFWYAIVALTVLWTLFLEIPEDLFNKLLLITFAGMSGLFGVGGFAMHTYNWPTIKLYAVLMFFGAGAQVTFGLMHWAGFFGVTSGTVGLVMDRKCGICLADDASSCNGGSLYDGLTGGDIDYANMPWYCCCALNQCHDFSKDLAQPASCVDGCTLADLSPVDNDESAANCETQAERLVVDNSAWNVATDGAPRMACTYQPASEVSCDPASPNADAAEIARCAAVLDGASGRQRRSLCEEASCLYSPASPETCTQTIDRPWSLTEAVCDDYKASNATCREHATCYYTPDIYGSVPNLSEEEQTAKDFCAGNEDYQDNLVNGIKATSLFGASTCFQEGKDADDLGSFAQCVAHSQETAQSGYIIFILLFCPVQLVAAYVGWVLPEIYFKSKEMEKERGFDMDDSVKFVNPLGGGSGSFDMDEEEPDPIEQMKSVSSAQEKARAAYRLRAEGKPIEGELPSGVSPGPIISKAEADRLFIKRGKTLKVALLTDKPDQKLGLVVDRNARCPPRISKVTPNGLAHERRLKAGWAILEVQGKLVEGDGYDECVAAIKNVDYHLGAGLQLKVMLPPGEQFDGEGESMSESDDEDEVKEAEQIAAAKRDAQRKKLEEERAQRERVEKERVEANKKRKLEQERKKKEAEKKAKEAAKEAARLKHEEEKKAKAAAKEAERLKHEEEKKAKAAAKEAERLKREEEKKAKAEAEAEAKEAAKKKKQEGEQQKAAQEAAAKAAAEETAEVDADNTTIVLDKGGGKRYKVLLPGVIRAGKDLTSEKLGNLHPPEEIVSLEEDGNRIRFDAHHDCDYPSGWISKEGAGGTKLLEEVGFIELE